MKVIIAGGRDFNDMDLLKDKCDSILSEQPQGTVEIVSGTAKGADKLGEQYAMERRFPIKSFPADWDKHKKAAGYIRNREMGEYADALIAFWDGVSRGTKHMIDIANELGLKVRVIRYD